MWRRFDNARPSMFLCNACILTDEFLHVPPSPSAAAELSMPSYIIDEIAASKNHAGAAPSQSKFTELTPEVLAATDVLYVTRVQKGACRWRASRRRVNGWLLSSVFVPIVLIVVRYSPNATLLRRPRPPTSIVSPAAPTAFHYHRLAERFASADEYERLKHAFIITPATLAQCKRPGMIVMHPLPRVGEIEESVDADPRAAYFRQMQYGLYLRMALLALVLGVTKGQMEAVLA